jgi:predicted SnoaL-like aldol condensation-catalyzing enzyme
MGFLHDCILRNRVARKWAIGKICARFTWSAIDKKEQISTYKGTDLFLLLGNQNRAQWRYPAMTTTTDGTDANKALVLAGIKGVFIDRDPTVLDRLFSDDYRQHNPQLRSGTAAIKALLANLSRDFKYEPGLVMADGDYVSIHGRYIGWGPKPMVAVDIFRVANGKIVEHWDVLQEEVPAGQSANGNSMFIGS